LSLKLLDTCVIIDLIPGIANSLDERFSREIEAGERLAVSTVSILEFRYGAERSRRRTQQLEALRQLCCWSKSSTSLKKTLLRQP